MIAAWSGVLFRSNWKLTEGDWAQTGLSCISKTWFCQSASSLVSSEFFYSSSLSEKSFPKGKLRVKGWLFTYGPLKQEKKKETWTILPLRVITFFGERNPYLAPLIVAYSIKSSIIYFLRCFLTQFEGKQWVVKKTYSEFARSTACNPHFHVFIKSELVVVRNFGVHEVPIQRLEKRCWPVKSRYMNLVAEKWPLWGVTDGFRKRST